MKDLRLSKTYNRYNDATLATSDCLTFLKAIPSNSAQLVLTSPPYNIGKVYEKPLALKKYLELQRRVIGEAVRVLRPGGSICWQVGHLIRKDGSIVPLDMLLFDCFAIHERSELRLRNRIIWHFEHGCHAHSRFSGRHEVILWYTKGAKYTFNIDALRVPQKYPGKRAYRGPKKGQLSGNPLGKNPGDVWLFPNVKGKHVEKTVHPCQFPIELADRAICAFTDPGDLVVDPFVGVGTTVAAALLRGRRGAGCDLRAEYISIARKRVKLVGEGQLRYRPRSRPIYKPDPNTALTRVPSEFRYVVPGQPTTLELKPSLTLPKLNGHVEPAPIRSVPRYVQG